LSAKVNGPRMRKFGEPKHLAKLPKPPKKATKTVSKLSGHISVPPKLKKFAGYLVLPLKKLTPRYFKNAWAELRLVTWPSRRESWRLTGAVFIFAIVFGLLIAGVDKVLDEIFKKTVLK